MGDYGVKIALPGKNINSTSPNDYAFWSKYQPKTYLYKQSTIYTATFLFNTYTFTHLLGFIPRVEVYLNSQVIGGTTKTRAPFRFDIDSSVSSPCSASGFTFEELVYVSATSSTIAIEIDRNCSDPFGFGKPTSAGSYTYNIDMYLYLPAI